MFKRTFIRLFLLGCLAFTLFFVLVSAQKASRSDIECTGSETKAENERPSGEFILESIVGSVLIGTK
jgi:hypothetical protein